MSHALQCAGFSAESQCINKAIEGVGFRVYECQWQGFTCHFAVIKDFRESAGDGAGQHCLYFFKWRMVKTGLKANKWEKWRQIQSFPYWHFNALLLQLLWNDLGESLHVLTPPHTVHFQGKNSELQPFCWVQVGGSCLRVEVLLSFAKSRLAW